jgi:carbon storage regulator
MLVLSRKRQERIMIGQDIEVTVLAIKGNRVELGIRAPSDVSIVRNELERRVQCAEHRPTVDQ